MKRIISILIVFITIVSCKVKKEVVVEKGLSEAEKKEIVDKIENYINGVDSYVYHINASAKDFDSISIDEMKWFRKSNHITKLISEKNTTLYRDKIVKLKKKESLENNFVKLKSFYYEEDGLVCVKIYELFPSKENEEDKVYKRSLYYNNNQLILDSKESDTKYLPNKLFSIAGEQLQEEYQSKIK